MRRFLADPERKVWISKANEIDRNHVETTMRNAMCDVDATTESRGQPYSLICTKNQASYQRHVTQRSKNLVDLERLGEVAESSCCDELPPLSLRA